jgi:hypothetical protein
LKAGQLIEDDEVDRRVGEVAAGDLPGRRRGSRVALAIPGFPGEAFAADVPMHLRLRPEESLLPVSGRPLTNCTTAACKLCPRARARTPKAALDLPLPVLISRMPRCSCAAAILSCTTDCLFCIRCS